MMRYRCLFLLLTVSLLLGCLGCQSHQDTLYSQVVSQMAEQPVVAPSADPNDPDYIGPPSPGPDAQLTPAPDDDLSGQLVIRSFVQTREPPDPYWLAREFMALHPQVKLILDFELKYSNNPSS